MYTYTIGQGTEDHFAQAVDWCHALISEQMGIQQWGGSKNEYSLQVKDGPVLKFLREAADGTCKVDTAEALPARLIEILKDASARVARGDMGKMQWWQMDLSSRKTVDASSTLHMMRMLGQSKAFKGRWRLGKDVIVDFTIEDPKLPAAFAKQVIHLTFRSIGPGHGPRSRLLAGRQADVIRAVLSFCTASALESGYLRPVTDDGFPPGSEVHSALPELSIQEVPIWSRLAKAVSNDAVELVGRVINALTAYEYALTQPTSGAATVFYVAAIEALTVPNHRYSHQRVTARFARSLLVFARTELEEALKHANFAEAFNSATKRVKNSTELANRIYGLRCSPVHTGNFGLERDFVIDMASGGPARVALLGEIAEAAILGFVKCPFTSLIGHSDFDPACRIELTEEEHEIVRLAAHGKGLSVEDYILQSLGLEPREAR